MPQINLLQFGFRKFHSINLTFDSISTMLSFGALNAKPHNEESTSNITFTEVHKEEQESLALELYNKGLSLQRAGEEDQAKETYLQLLEEPLLKQAAECVVEDEDVSQHPALFLKYNVLKNLAGIAHNKEDYETALDYYLEAAIVDESDVSLWWKVGQIAMKTLNIRLARYAFEKGLIYSSGHWPSLDNLITVLYIVGDYYACLQMISTAFERDPTYVKGFALRDQIFKEEEHFKKDFMDNKYLFITCDEILQEEREQYVEEALILREKRRLQAKREELPKVKFKKQVFYSWSSLGESLLDMYEELSNPANKQSLCWPVDLEKYYRTPEQQASIVVPSPEVLMKKAARSSIKECENKGIKRKKPTCLFEKEGDPQPKRRSTRVRTSKTKEADINWFELIHSFLPPHLRYDPSMETEESQDSMQDFVEENKSTTQAVVSKPDDLKKEAVCVSQFINSNIKNCGCVDVCSKFLLKLTDFLDTKWSPGIPTVYRKLFKYVRKHLQMPNLFSDTNDDVYMSKLGKMILLGLEFELDCWLTNNAKGLISISPAPSPSKNDNNPDIFDIGHDELHKFQCDLQYIAMLSESNPFLDQDSEPYRTRFLWLQGRFFILKGDNRHAKATLESCGQSLLDYTNQPGSMLELCNCQTDNIISKTTIQEKIESMQRSQSLDEVQLMFDNGNVEQVISILSPLLQKDQEKTNIISDSTSVDRPTQLLLLLLEAYLHVKDYKNCYICAEVCLSETLQVLAPSETWKTHIERLLKCLNECLSASDSLLLVSNDTLAKLTQNIIKVIEFIMDTEDISMASVLPSLVLTQIMKFHSLKSVDPDRSFTKEENSMDSVTSDIPDTPHYIQYLRTMHEHLGRKSWCCVNEGLFLLEFIKYIGQELKTEMNSNKRQDLYGDMEQCFTCLYGNPKKSKGKGIQDHGVAPIPLSWEVAKIMYVFYKPEDIPELDLKTYTISIEVQNVFRKIVSVVPQREVEVFSFETLQQYIDGGDDLPVVSAEEIQSKQSGIDDLFYYLGDFYFKNKEFSKALKYYMHDVCLQPLRFQSWAAMGLARASRLEEKMNSCELKSDGPIKKHITSTLRCYEKAVKIKNTRCVVMEEYGSTAYMLNSYYSRRMHEDMQDNEQTTASQENFHAKRKEMLELAEQCFDQARKVTTEIQGELWLHYYMLGKTSEKLDKPPDVFMKHYQRSLSELYQSGGRYKQKLPYHGAPRYSIEAVEIFYRIHTSILKFVQKDCSAHALDVAEKHLNLVREQEIYKDWISSKGEANCSPKTPTSDETRTLVTTNDLSIGQETELTNDIAMEDVSVDKAPDKDDSTQPTKSDIAAMSEHSETLTAVTEVVWNTDLNSGMGTGPYGAGSETFANDVDLCLSGLLDKVSLMFSDTQSSVHMSIKGAATSGTSKDNFNDKNKKDGLRDLRANQGTSPTESRYLCIIDRCIEAFSFCLTCFPEHYKSQYRLAHTVARSESHQNFLWSRDLLLGPSCATAPSTPDYPIPLPTHGIFMGKKKSNLFQYLWRIPVDEVDRPGSFCSHISRCIELLLDVLLQLEDWSMLLHVSGVLYKTPDRDKKYLRDNDRAFLAIKANDFMVEVFKKKLNKLDKSSNDKDKVQLLLDIYEAYKHSQRTQSSSQTIEHYMVRAYQLMRTEQVSIEEERLLLDDAIKFCQQRIEQARKQITSSTPTAPVPNNTILDPSTKSTT